MGPPKCGAPGNCPVCPPPLKPTLPGTYTFDNVGITHIIQHNRYTYTYSNISLHGDGD